MILIMVTCPPREVWAATNPRCSEMKLKHGGISPETRLAGWPQ
jgi:hypothetical protein